ncbi:DUF523 domain-containing protein [Vagococcus acidifermentans]|uniref:Uncharacterized protein n=1 Tax=Vagococcus acidifermentans TaxID=564710 RepID=A0A430AVQ8_9ENTE|nr:DUF523 domain-containing protein [Vagococcus acidifermentans]RSU12154.1 hypothetical protein CBF27_06950 [Vagococcus acidifermentans]
MIGISACLGGVSCRYDGKAKTVEALRRLVASEQALVICPEVLGGLPVPRIPAEIQFGDGFDVWAGKAHVIAKDGKDVTGCYKQGAEKALAALKELDIDWVILKENSPSCGVSAVYDGSFTGSLREGLGVAAALFQMNDILICSESNWQDVLPKGGTGRGDR